MTRNLRYIVSALLTITLLFGCISPYTVKAAVSETDIASFLFTRPSGSEADKDLNDTYKTNADSGYYASSGRYKTSARFYASVFPVLHLTTESWNGAQITITHITD